LAPQLAGLHHLMAPPILFARHFAGALWCRFVMRDDVVTMVRPAR